LTFRGKAANFARFLVSTMAPSSPWQERATLEAS
jgi:hypothetical protein